MIFKLLGLLCLHLLIWTFEKYAFLWAAANPGPFCGRCLSSGYLEKKTIQSVADSAVSSVILNQDVSRFETE
jgi:hypothetical protein